MSLRISPSTRDYVEAFKILDKHGLDGNCIENALLKEGIETRAKGEVSTNSENYRMAMALITSNFSLFDKYKNMNAITIRKIMFDKIERVVENILSENHIVSGNVKESEEFKKIYDALTSHPVVYKDRRMAEKQITNF
jgi:hypothetical protein